MPAYSSRPSEYTSAEASSEPLQKTSGAMNSSSSVVQSFVSVRAGAPRPTVPSSARLMLSGRMPPWYVPHSVRMRQIVSASAVSSARESVCSRSPRQAAGSNACFSM